MMFMMTMMAAQAADVSTTVSLKASEAYGVETHKVKVSNASGNARNVSVTIQLPETNTSPSVYVLGDLVSYDSRCVEVGTTLECSLGRIKGGRAKTVSFEMALPWSAADLEFEATASTTSSDSNASNDSDSDVASVSYIDTVISGPQDITNQHCTGTSLVAFYECALFPSSLSGHTATLESDGSISFSFTGYGGSWGQDSDDHLWMEYTSGGSVVAEFEGNGVGGDCFEGLTTFPGSSYVSPYEVCLD